MKILKLCRECPEKNYCSERCIEALAAEEEDNSSNYTPAKDYEVKGIPLVSYKESRRRLSIEELKHD